jgi:hypothetical protein
MLSIIIALGIIIGCFISLWHLESWYVKRRTDIQNQYRGRENGNNYSTKI